MYHAVTPTGTDFLAQEDVVLDVLRGKASSRGTKLVVAPPSLVVRAGMKTIERTALLRFEVAIDVKLPA